MHAGAVATVLHLAAQVGEHEVVLEAGRKALEKWEARAFRRDILYAMTLAHLGLASEALKAKEQASIPLRQEEYWQ